MNRVLAFIKEVSYINVLYPDCDVYSRPKQLIPAKKRGLFRTTNRQQGCASDRRRLSPHAIELRIHRWYIGSEVAGRGICIRGWEQCKWLTGVNDAPVNSIGHLPLD
ncbi:hypothetical protein CBL_09319 [Carabus blaptoides fortunei]